MAHLSTKGCARISLVASGISTAVFFGVLLLAPSYVAAYDPIGPPGLWLLGLLMVFSWGTSLVLQAMQLVMEIWQERSRKPIPSASEPNGGQRDLARVLQLGIGVERRMPSAGGYRDTAALHHDSQLVFTFSHRVVRGRLLIPFIVLAYLTVVIWSEAGVEVAIPILALSALFAAAAWTLRKTTSSYLRFDGRQVKARRAGHNQPPETYPIGASARVVVVRRDARRVDRAESFDLVLQSLEHGAPVIWSFADIAHATTIAEVANEFLKETSATRSLAQDAGGMNETT